MWSGAGSGLEIEIEHVLGLSVVEHVLSALSTQLPAERRRCLGSC
jgi:hypothetical protein